MGRGSDLMTIFIIAVFILFTIAILELAAFVFYKYIYTPHKVISNTSSLTELLTILNLIINTEFTLYEKNIFSTKGALTNANFENFYRDIVNNVINSLSDDFFIKMEFYIKSDAVVAIISRNVHNFLVEKVNTVI